MAISDFAKEYHEKMFPGYRSVFGNTDAEFIERFDNFAFDEVAQRIIESVDVEPAPWRMVLGSQALKATIARLKERIADYEMQMELAASTDIFEL